MLLPPSDEGSPTILRSCLQIVRRKSSRNVYGGTNRQTCRTAQSIQYSSNGKFLISHVVNVPRLSSFVVPIPKSAPTSSPFNYPPISLVSKLLEKHIHTLLYDFCISNNLISPFQFGFLPYHSTISALYSTHTIFSLLESYSSVCGAFLDLRKAFDSVPHQPLLDLLASSNLPPPLLNWLHSYLLNRTQCVVVNGSSSSSLLVPSGVPQGSILGPLLFLIFVNGLTDFLSLLSHV